MAVPKLIPRFASSFPFNHGRATLPSLQGCSGGSAMDEQWIDGEFLVLGCSVSPLSFVPAMTTACRRSRRFLQSIWLGDDGYAGLHHKHLAFRLFYFCFFPVLSLLMCVLVLQWLRCPNRVESVFKNLINMFNQFWYYNEVFLCRV